MVSHRTDVWSSGMSSPAVGYLESAAPAVPSWLSRLCGCTAAQATASLDAGGVIDAGGPAPGGPALLPGAPPGSGATLLLAASPAEAEAALSEVREMGRGGGGRPSGVIHFQGGLV